MSALGQKQTFRSANAMSALPPKADIGAAQINVRIVPIADIALMAPTETFRARHGVRRLFGQSGQAQGIGELRPNARVLHPHPRAAGRKS